MYWVLLMCGYVLCRTCEGTSSSQPQVLTAQGVVRGLYTKTDKGRQIASFEGIPYAKPPIGKHRFKEAIFADPWLGIYNATKEAPQCYQLDVFFSNPPAVLGSENCLYLNVYTPILPSDTAEHKPLDVIAFIHGGGFMGGKSGMHGPSLLLDRDVVLVTFNYRVGPLGFLSTEDNVVPGNNGLKDQVLALKWIKQNIAAFGGNPDSVTIGGMSAGGASCHYLLLSPLCKGLFKGALCMSGAALNPWAMSEHNKEKAQIIASDLGCPTNDSLRMVKCLRNRPAQHITALSQLFIYRHGNPFAIFGPVIEPPSPNAFLSDSPINAVKQKLGSDVPVIFSYTADEGAGFLCLPNILEGFKTNWDELVPHFLDYNFTVDSERKLEIGQKIKEFYKVDNTTEKIPNMVKMASDRLFIAGISKTAKMHASVFTSPVYMYKFSYRGDISIMSYIKSEVFKNDKYVVHGEDTFYTVGLMNMNLETERDRAFSKTMLDLWVTFAANGTLGENWQPIDQQLPKIAFTEIKDIDNFKLIVEDELGEESFWDSLGLNENIEPSISSHDEL